MYSFGAFKTTSISLWALNNFFGYLTFSYGERFSMNQCIIYDVLDLDVSVSQKAVFKVCSPN